MLGRRRSARQGRHETGACGAGPRAHRGGRLCSPTRAPPGALSSVSPLTRVSDSGPVTDTPILRPGLSGVRTWGLSGPPRPLGAPGHPSGTQSHLPQAPDPQPQPRASHTVTTRGRPDGFLKIVTRRSQSQNAVRRPHCHGCMTGTWPGPRGHTKQPRARLLLTAAPSWFSRGDPQRPAPAWPPPRPPRWPSWLGGFGSRRRPRR